METALRIRTTVLPGNRIEISDSGLREGDEVVVTVVPLNGSARGQSSMLDLLGTPPGPRTFATWSEYERHLEEERNAWDR